MKNIRENLSPQDFYETIYAEKKPAEHQWVAGSASPELIKLVWEGVLKPGMNVLEIGSGVGTESVFMAVRGMKVTGMDLSTSAVKLAKQLANFYGVNANFLQGNILTSKLPKNNFDVVCDQGVFHHIADPDRETFAKNIADVLKPGGMLLLRCFSDKIPGGPQPRRIKSRELTDTFLEYFDLEHMERVLSFSTEQREKPLGWHTIWIKK
jgi:2-polyprenyl-3-methyl-5-hydroxy-6-metoxy-1,4-benzoquinol methylase